MLGLSEWFIGRWVRGRFAGAFRDYWGRCVISADCRNIFIGFDDCDYSTQR